MKTLKWFFILMSVVTLVVVWVLGNAIFWPWLSGDELWGYIVSIIMMFMAPVFAISVILASD